MRAFDIRDARVGGSRLLVVAGPCVVESEELCLTVAAKLQTLTAERGLPFVFKRTTTSESLSCATTTTLLVLESMAISMPP